MTKWRTNEEIFRELGGKDKFSEKFPKLLAGCAAIMVLEKIE
jgi:hypothetical protein